MLVQKYLFLTNYIITCQVILSPFLFSQSLNPIFEQITTEHGLSNNRINNTIKDSRGFIWIVTADGINRYDGLGFKIYRYDPGDSTSISGNFVYSITEDRNGDLWLCTRSNGLSKLNRKTGQFSRFKLYDPEASIREKERLNTTYYIYEDKYEVPITLWATSNGANKKRTYINGVNNYHIGVMSGSVAIVDSNHLWIGATGGLRKFIKNSNSTIRYSHRDIHSGKNVGAINMYLDSDGLLWLAAWEKGLNVFDTKSETFIGYIHNPDHPRGIGSNVVFDVNADRSGFLWLVTAGDGYYRYDKNENKFTCFKEPEVYTRLGLNYWGQSYIDDTDIHWISTKNDGLFKYAPTKNKFKHYILATEGEKNVDVRAFFKDKSDSLWVSTVDALYKFDIRTGKFSKKDYDPTHTRNILRHSISTFLGGNDDYVWLGTEGGGLKRYHHKSKQVRDTYTFINTDINGNVSHSDNYILSMTADLNGHIWIENFGDHGHYLFDKINLKFVNTRLPLFFNLPLPLETERLFIDRLGNYYYTTWLKGLYLMDSTYTIVHNFRHKQNDPSTISNNHINTVYEDVSDNIWIGTAGGLNLYDHNAGTFRSFVKKEGLASDIILSILEDNHRNLWLATPAGITRFALPDSAQPRIKNYTVSDPITLYAEEVSYKDDNGFMYFGGKNGFISFHPDSIIENTRIPPIVITDFKLFNQSIQADSENKSPLRSDITETNEIKLTYDQNFFSFEFAALDYTNPQQNLYAYKLEGIDRDWIYTDASQRFANYTNVQPGEYVFMVKGSNNDAVWNEEGTAIRILITPPWWQSNMAYAGYIFLVILVLYVLRRYDKKRQNLKHELEMEHLHAEKLEEVDRAKSRFFTNISHEFRTPLTLITGPMKQLINGEFKGNLIEQYRMILRNSERLLGLVNQLLDFSRLESGKMKLEVRKTDIIALLKEFVLSFSSLAETKKILLKFKSDTKSLSGYIDRDKVEKIVSNLLSNAFKFTAAGREISLIVKNPKVKIQMSNEFQNPEFGFVEIKISNHGPEIPADQLDKIFDRFYQADTTYNKDSEGSGIGLALTKELVELHHGSIELTCEKYREKPASNEDDLYLTTFKILLPVGKEHYSYDEITGESAEPIPDTGRSEAEIPTSRGYRIPHPESGIEDQVSHIPYPTTDSVRPEPSTEKRALRILIVEDNPDVTSYITSFFKNDYRIISAENGEVGWKKALDKIPDLVISDVMMPVMDGFELCKKIKSDQRTSHIPVILLTAKADMDSKIEGLEFGADDYISKPFEARELLARVSNIIGQRRLLREKFSRMIEINPAEVTTCSMDEAFIKHFMKVFDAHISEPEFSTEQFALEIGMSRMHLNRKLQALNNQSTHEFILTLRLKRAAQLLQKSTGSVSEIAYSLGFNSPSHFSYAFRKQFGQPPSNFSRQKTQ